MRSHFIGYYRPSPAEFRKLWAECFFSFDANVLLNLYTWRKETRNAFFGILSKVNDRIWLSNQAAKEYFHGRLGAIQAQRDAYSNFAQTLERSHKDLTSLFEKHSSSDDVRKIISDLDDAYVKAQIGIEAVESSQPNFIDDDEILTHLTELFSARVGDAYPREELSKLQKIIDERLENHIPPGYRDANKKGKERRYGDVLIWFQLLAQARERKSPFILVTDDLKDDWWQFHRSSSLGPRPELIAEVRETANVGFYMYSSERFITFAAKHLGTAKDEKAVADILKARERAQDEHRIQHELSERLKHERSEMLAMGVQRDRLVAELEKLQDLADAGHVPDGQLWPRLERLEDELRVVNYELALRRQAVDALEEELHSDFPNIGSIPAIFSGDMKGTGVTAKSARSRKGEMRRHDTTKPRER